MIATWQDLAVLLGIIFDSKAPELMMLAFVMYWVYRLHGVVQRLDGRVQHLESDVKNIHVTLKSLDERGMERDRELKEHERVCADRWGQVQRELGAIHTAVGTPYAPVSLKPPQPES